MAVPQHRNQKKTYRRRRTGHTVVRRRLLLDQAIEEHPPSFEEWLDEIRYPGDWLENEYLEQPDLGERLLGSQQGRLLDHHSEDNDDYSDPDDFYDIW